MNIVCINSSPRKQGNISKICNEILRGSKEKEHQVEMVFLYDYQIQPCTGCWVCAKTQKCYLKDDFEHLYRKVERADYVILGVPNYWCNLPAILVNFIQRHTAYALWKPQDAQKFKNLPNIRRKVQKMWYCFKHFGPLNSTFSQKKFIFVITGTSPFRHILGEYRAILLVLRKYVKKLHAHIYHRIIYTDTLFCLKKRKKEKLMEKAYRIGLNV